MARHARIAGSAGILAAALLLAPTAWSQQLPQLDPPASGTDTNVLRVDTTNAPAVSATPAAPVAPDQRFLQQIKGDYSFLPGSGGQGLQINTVALSARFAVPVVDGWAPLLVTPGAVANFWDGPTLGGVSGPPHLPPQLYDLSVELGWKPQLAPWLFADLAVTPGVYSDFKDTASDSFQMRGRGVAIVALSEQWQFAAGALYVNRNKIKVLPAGGVIWRPDEDTCCLLLFPQPKVSHRLTTVGQTQWWAYLAGDFGGGRWSVERTDGSHDLLDYTDLRVSLGLEAIMAKGLTGRFEVGYVFARRVNFTSDTPDFLPRDTLMVKAGFCY